MPDSFGARLRQRRERQQIALSTIAEQTKIKVSLLEALEQDDVSHWPSGIFRRAFIRAYAHAIGLEPDVVVREFLELYPDPAEIVATVPAGSSNVHEAYTGGPPTRLRNIVGSAIGSLSRLGSRTVAKPQTAAADQSLSFHRFDGDSPDLPLDFSGYTEPDTSDFPPPEPVDRREEVPECADPPAPPLLAEPTPVAAPTPADGPDLLAFAQLCTAFGRVDGATDIAPLLREATDLLGAVGLIVWIWDARAVELCPVLAHGYSDQVLAQLPRVDRETNNATAAAFRAAQTCVVNSTDRDSGALVVPLMTPAGCAGVLAIELQHSREEIESVRALSMIFAAQLATLIGSAQPAEASDRRLA
jgi:transcriptional regulator with XRE-family HTH domain